MVKGPVFLFCYFLFDNAAMRICVVMNLPFIINVFEEFIIEFEEFDFELSSQFN